MGDTIDYIAKSAPFLLNNWPYLIVTIILAFAFIYMLSSKQQGEEKSSKSKKGIVSLDRGEHPLAEFEDDKPDLSLAPSLHDANTPQIPYTIDRFSDNEMNQRARDFYEQMNKRRSVRFFSSDPVPLEVVQDIIRTAGTSPSGAHSEPWTFVVVQDKKIKSQVRENIEQEEYLNYDRRMGDRWVNDLKYVKTYEEPHVKPYLDDAPYIILVFKQQYHIGEDGVRYAHYYYEISTAIAIGILLMAIHNAGLVTVATTPMNAGGALRELLGRPSNEKLMLVLPIGFPTQDATVPDVKRKPLEKIMVLK